MWTVMWGIMLSGGLLLLFNHLMGYRKDYIQIDFEERYTNHHHYVQSIKHDLKEKGYEVWYEGDHKFVINGKGFVYFGGM
ncbi:hypothetical protein [Thalassobacillus sp. CUG 92003]|uniref:hypothetical protein n=1 Tax=Thalassobacillus sp. CUG 92003 TaxID=2736641 RepID=UPI002107F7B0|nr:hypothetical protein [Thalassobacillus sp. CUG 92003]